MTGSIFSQLPNNLIMNIIKMETDRKKEEELKQEAKYKFEDCMTEINGLSYVYHYDPYEDIEFERNYYDEKAEYYLRTIFKQRFHDRYYGLTDKEYRVPNWLIRERVVERAFMESDSDDDQPFSDDE